MCAIEIGQIKHSLCSSSEVIDITEDCYISQNKDYYSVNGCLFGLRFKIEKESIEGKQLESLLTSILDIHSHGNYLVALEEYIDKLVLKYITPKQLKAHIEAEKLESFLDGKKAIQEEIRKCLGIADAD